LLRKAHSVSHGILERIQKVIGSPEGVYAEKNLLAETFRRIWKVMADKPPARA
jgi:hypothetical protein